MKNRQIKLIILLVIIINSFISFSQVNDISFHYKKYVKYDFFIDIEADNRIFYPDFNYRSESIQNSYNPYAKLKLFIKYGCSNSKLTKPFIFVEGVSFDKKSIRDGEYGLWDYFQMNGTDNIVSSSGLLEEVRNENMIPPSIYANGTSTNHTVGYSTFNWATLVTGVDAEGVEDGEPLQIQKSPELLQKLYDNGFDIVFVDFESGQQYMENNGFALSKALKLIKDSLDNNESQEKMVVCGASMGGLVSRFAIKDLELNGGSNYNNCISKFISFDSPQMGANINLGMQYLLQNFNVLPVDLIKDRYSKLTCPSASQLVLYSCLADPIDWYLPMKLSTASESMERFLFNNHPNALTWPTNCKKISIINGSRNGIKQNNGSVDACERLFDGDGLVSLDIKSLPKYNQGYCKIYDFELPTLTCQPSFEILAQIISNNSVRVKNSRGVDIVAGSYRNDLHVFTEVNHWLSSLVAGVAAPCNLISYFTPSTNSAPNYCFIPALSAFGHKNFNSLVELSHDVLPFLFNGKSKFEDPNHQHSHFDVVYAPLNNQTHVEITDENIEWVMYELLDIEDTHLLFQNETVETRTHKAEKTIRAGRNVGKFPCANTSSILTSGEILQPSNLPPPQFTSINTNIQVTVSPGQEIGEMWDYLSNQAVPFKSYLVSFISTNYELSSEPQSAFIYSDCLYGTVIKQITDYTEVNNGNILTGIKFFFNIYNTSNECNPAIISGNYNHTIFLAGEKITLEPGFYTEENAIFEASIFTLPNCENTNSGGRYSNEDFVNKTSYNSSGNRNLLNKTSFFKIETSLIENKNHITIFPNPANNNFTINASEQIISYVVYDVSGKQITRQENVAEKSIQVSSENLNTGIYFVNIITAKSNQTTKLMISND